MRNAASRESRSLNKGMQEFYRQPDGQHESLSLARSAPMSSDMRKRLTWLSNGRLNVQGYAIGIKLLDLLLFREPPRTQIRPQNIIALLHFIKQNVWQHLFNRQADRLEKSSDADKPDEYMIIDNEPLVNQYISVPREMSQLNCAAFVAGIVEGVCDGADFPAKVTAHTVSEGEMWPGKTVFLVKFKMGVVEREAFLAKS